jgi:hypothetical protein
MPIQSAWQICLHGSNSPPSQVSFTAWVSHPRHSGGQHYTLQNSYVKTLQHILPNIPDNGTIQGFMAAPCAEPWIVVDTWDWMDEVPASTHDLSVWSSSSLRRWHPRSSVPLVLTRHSSPILNKEWTRVIYLSMFFIMLGVADNAKWQNWWKKLVVYQVLCTKSQMVQQENDLFGL